ncbi:hypothetical protein GOBAR_AA16540 [Gossypium barbadense]|uniref:Uncharacterized protein n=1 Tax=Gossypium barbadense TaxID=3634 RepID=A0A2P5XLG3_GOSBA|nr:hypothetical protein GOBAR_AA16540 [Gossypium barbadense]
MLDELRNLPPDWPPEICVQPSPSMHDSTSVLAIAAVPIALAMTFLGFSFDILTAAKQSDSTRTKRLKMFLEKKKEAAN